MYKLNSRLHQPHQLGLRIPFRLAVPGSPDYNELLKVIFAWYGYWVPIIPFAVKFEPYEYAKSLIDPLWLFQPYIVNHYPQLIAITAPYTTAWGSSGNYAYSYAWLLGWVLSHLQALSHRLLKLLLMAVFGLSMSGMPSI